MEPQKLEGGLEPVLPQPPEETSPAHTLLSDFCERINMFFKTLPSLWCAVPVAHTLKGSRLRANEEETGGKKVYLGKRVD